MHPVLPAQRRGEEVTLPVTKVAAVVLVVELCQVRRGVNREEGLCSTAGSEAPMAGCIITEEIFREDGSKWHAG